MGNEAARVKDAVQSLAETLQVDKNVLKKTIMLTMCPDIKTDEQFVAFVVVANTYGLNPMTRELWAFPDKRGGIVPIVSTDGWTKKLVDHPKYLSHEFIYSKSTIKIGTRDFPEWCECIIYKKDETKSVTREYMIEVYRNPIKKKDKEGKWYEIKTPWQTHAMRMLKHKTKIQATRETFGYGGIYDQDEAERIIEAQAVKEEPKGKPLVAMPKPIEKQPQEQPQEPVQKQEVEDVEDAEVVSDELKAITQEQINLLESECMKKGISKAKLLLYLNKEFGITSEKHILDKWFGIVLSRVKR